MKLILSQKKILIRTGRIVLVVMLMSFLNACMHPGIYMKKDKDWKDLKLIAVLPFENLSGSNGAGDVVRNMFVVELNKMGRFGIVKPGDARALLLEKRVKVKGEIDFETLYAFRKELNAGGVIVGSVEEYGEEVSGPKKGIPAVRIDARMLDTKSGEVIWSAVNSRYGDDRAAILDIGEIRSVNALAEKTVAEMLLTLRNPPRGSGKSGSAVKTDDGEDIGVRLAKLYYNRGSYDLAVQKLEYALKSSADRQSSMNLMYMLGISYEKSGMEDKALASWQRYRIKYPDSRTLEIRFRIGRINRILKNYSKALNELQKAAAGSDSRWAGDAYLEMGNLFFDKGEYGKALDFYKNYLTKYPESRLVPEAVMRLGESRYRLKDYEDSLKTLYGFIKKFPSDKNIRQAEYLAGLSLQNLKRWRESISHFQAAFQKASGEESEGLLIEEIEYRMGLSYWNLGDRGQARNFFLKADKSKLSGKSADDIRLKLGDIYYSSGKYRQALIELAGFAAGEKTDDRIIYKVARCYEELGRFAEALKIYSKISSGNDKVITEKSLFHTANIYKSQGDLKGAVKTLKKLISIGGAYADRAKMNMAGIFYQQMSLEKALSIYKDIAENSDDQRAVNNAEKWIKTLEFKIKERER